MIVGMRGMLKWGVERMMEGVAEVALKRGGWDRDMALVGGQAYNGSGSGDPQSFQQVD